MQIRTITTVTKFSENSIIYFTENWQSLATKTYLKKHFQRVYNPGVAFKMLDMINVDEQK